MRDRIDPRHVWRWASSRAWTRAGAVAAVLAVGAPRRVAAATTRAALLLAGSVAIGAAVGVMLWNDFGPGPLDVFIGAVRTSLDLPLTLAVWGVVSVLVVVAWLLGRSPGIGTVLSPIVVGPAMQATVAGLEWLDRPDVFAVQLVVHVSAIGLVGIGSGLLIASGLGAGSGELLAFAASDRSGRPVQHVRTVVELSWFGLGVALGGPFGVGTIVVAVLIGPAVATGHRIVDAAMTASRRRVALSFG